MSEQFWWFLARASGIVAWAVLAAAVACGLVLATRLVAGREVRRWLIDMHRFLGGLGVALTVVHLVALVADSYVHFDLVDLLVPMASEWRPGAVAYGVVALWFLLAVELSSLAMRRLPRRAWRTIHLGSYASFALATVHGLTAGTDLGGRLAVAATVATVAAIAALLALRIVTGRRARRRARRRVAAAPVRPLTNAEPVG